MTKKPWIEHPICVALRDWWTDDRTTLEAYQEAGEAWVEFRQALIEAVQLERIGNWLGMKLKDEYRFNQFNEYRQFDDRWSGEMNILCWLLGHLWETRGLVRGRKAIVTCRRCGAWEKMR